MKMLLGVLLVVAGSAHATEPEDPLVTRSNELDVALKEVQLQKAQLDLMNAAAPASGTTEKTDVKGEAGKFEAQILMARALAPAAKVIIDATQNAKGKITLFAGYESEMLPHWDLFELRVNTLTEAYSSINLRFKALEGNVMPRLLDPASIAAITAAFSSASKLVSYAMSDYETGGIKIENDDDLLATAVLEYAIVCNDDPSIFLPRRLISNGASKEAMGMITALDTGRQTADQNARTADKRIKALEELAKTDKNDEIATRIKEYKAIVQETGVVTAGHDSFLTMLSNTDEKNPLPFNKVVQEMAVAKALGSDGYGLFVKMHSAGGSYYTKKNLWTAFGGMPFYVSGGAVVSYTLIKRGDGKVAAAGVIPVLNPYQKASTLSAAYSAASCNKPNGIVESQALDEPVHDTAYGQVDSSN